MSIGSVRTSVDSFECCDQASVYYLFAAFFIVLVSIIWIWPTVSHVLPRAFLFGLQITLVHSSTACYGEELAAFDRHLSFVLSDSTNFKLVYDES